jgi:hypothetical protein
LTRDADHSGTGIDALQVIAGGDLVAAVGKVGGEPAAIRAYFSRYRKHW